MLRKKDGWNMSVRDNGRQLNPLAVLEDGCRFDPVSILKEETEDVFSNIGIKLVCGMARKTEYIDTLNINSLNIEV